MAFEGLMFALMVARGVARGEDPPAALARAAFRYASRSRALGILRRAAERAADAGRPGEAVRLYRLMAEAGDDDAIAIVVNWPGIRDDAAAVEAVYRSAVEAGNLRALSSLAGMVAARGAIEEARRLYRQGVDAGDVDALTAYGVFLRSIGELDQAINRLRLLTGGFRDGTGFDPGTGGDPAGPGTGSPAGPGGPPGPPGPTGPGGPAGPGIGSAHHAAPESGPGGRAGPDAGSAHHAGPETGPGGPAGPDTGAADARHSTAGAGGAALAELGALLLAAPASRAEAEAEAALRRGAAVLDNRCRCLLAALLLERGAVAEASGLLDRVFATGDEFARPYAEKLAAEYELP